MPFVATTVTFSDDITAAAADDTDASVVLVVVYYSYSTDLVGLVIKTTK